MTLPLFLSSNGLIPESSVLSAFAARRGWNVFELDYTAALPDLSSLPGDTAFFGDTITARALCDKGLLRLLEPEFDLLCSLGRTYLKRDVVFGKLRLCAPASESLFIKPADPCRKAFRAQVYQPGTMLFDGLMSHSEELVLVAEPVSWTCEFRAVVHRGNILSIGPYARFGKRTSDAAELLQINRSHRDAAIDFCKSLLSEGSLSPPPAFVLDVGEIDGRGWAVVEFNPIWCSRFSASAKPSYLDALLDTTVVI